MPVPAASARSRSRSPSTWRVGRDDHQHGQRRLGASAGRRQRHRLPQAGLHRSSCATTTSCSTPSAARRWRSRCSVLRPGGKIVFISGPPDPAFAREIGARPAAGLRDVPDEPWHPPARRQPRRRYEFFFMRRAARSCANSPGSSTPASSGRSSTACSPSRRSKPPSTTWKPAAPKAKLVLKMGK